ncbi:CHRD domain-containing protein [Ramlibacter sp. AW1]|uniref:CHRD domain-containing protein n=1 Tax=Ramlibacter aurantiacus TaxID=2801330 RepID=A0A937D6C2_9BURK|nr:CHRD domain-containing protein [Ramlibacter aurantiacus]MBL0419661.1 CHRD domain-containing protein [Ramlibacter aurantiacus]
MRWPELLAQLVSAIAKDPTMNPTKSRASLLAAGLLSITAWATPAFAGHVNPVLHAELDGREEVPAGATNRAIAGDPDARAEAYVFGIDGDPRTLCYLIVNVKKLGEVEMAPGAGRAAHIHEAARGANGPVVANLAWPQNGQAADCLTEGETDPSGLKFPTGEAGIVQRILNNPSNFYINVHNSEYPAGAIRGQLGETEHQHGAASGRAR